MIRAILFDFYGVWTPDVFNDYIAKAEQQDPGLALQLREVVDKYYVGLVDIEHLADRFRFLLEQPDLPLAIFKINQADISPVVVDFMRYLHGHFLKIGIIANIGRQEYNLLSEFNATHQLFETITVSLDIGGSVLSKEGFVQALQTIGEPPGSCLVVTRSAEYQKFAESNGISVLRFQDFPLLRKSLAQLIENKP